MLPSRNSRKYSKYSRIVNISSLTIILLSLTLYCFKFTPKTTAHLYRGLSVLDQAPAPVPDFKMPCDQVGDPEFHSLRPYQAAPCGDSPKVRYCWNNYLISEEISRQWGPDCVQVGDVYQCPTPNLIIERYYTVDGEYARFPIMGNTEMVSNSQGP